MATKKDRINNPDNSKAVQQILLDGKATEFWHILCEVIDQNIKHVERQIFDREEGGSMDASEYKVWLETLKNRRHDLMELKNLPDSLMMKMNQPDQSIENFDPYATEKDFMSNE